MEPLEPLSEFEEPPPICNDDREAKDSLVINGFFLNLANGLSSECSPEDALESVWARLDDVGGAIGDSVGCNSGGKSSGRGNKCKAHVML
mmetsp:Transcript_25439/g.54732  ORF Transcript_25439/g.54732 Transcript_25439/m.54732 type:complete len:90 (-) Transcript_25439:1676-1945(-)